MGVMQSQLNRSLHGNHKHDPFLLDGRSINLVMSHSHFTPLIGQELVKFLQKNIPPKFEVIRHCCSSAGGKWQNGESYY